MTKYHQAFKLLALLAVVLSIGMASTAFAESTGQYIDDSTITGKVKEAILTDSQLSVLQVRVDTSHGVVLLSGAVDTKAQDSQAVKLASQVNGVTSVTDNIFIKATRDQ
jgi:osmotically-inducible protein OsmY